MRKKILTIFLGCCSMLSNAQDKTVEAAEKSYGKASLNFINNAVYNGRKDSLRTPYLTPTIGYYHKSGFFIDGSFSWLNQSGNSRIDLATIDAGYDFSFGNFQGEVIAEKYFYNKSSTNVSAEIKGDISAMALYDFRFIETFLQPGIIFGTKTDYWLSWGIDHRFQVADKKLEITPTLLLNAATRNFYTSYFGNRRFKPRAGFQPPTVTASMKDASKLILQNYEWSLPLTYSSKNFSFGFTPFYSIAVNPAVVTVTIKPVNGPAFNKIITEKIGNTFYFSLDASVTF